MASFLDSASLPLNPYIGKYDVNAYVREGLEKQQQYNQGVQRVQGILDSVGGMEVYGDSRRAYLQNKVDDLTTKLQSAAGADWSNPAMLNQVGALAGQISKDPVIQNAVASAANIKSLMSSQRQLKEKSPDKYGPQNEWYDNQAVQSYLNNQDPGAIYNGPKQATELYDVDKAPKDILSKLAPNTSYTINSDGRYQLLIDKSQKINAGKIESLVNEYIQNDPKAQQQLAINAQYNFKDYTPSQLKQHISIYTDNKIANLNQLNEELKAQKLKLGNNNTAANQYDADIAYNTSKIKSLNEGRDQYFSAIDNGNINAVKQSYGLEHFRDNYVNEYQKDNHELELKADESAIKGTQFTLENEKLKLERIKEGIDPNTGAPMDPSNPYYQLYKNKLKGSKEGAGTGTGTDESQTLVGKGGTSGPYTLAKNEENIQNLTKKGDDLNEALKREYYKKNNLSDGPQADSLFKDWKSLQENAYQNQSTGVDPIYKDYKQASIQNNVELGVLSNLRDNILQDAKSQYSISKNLDKDITISGLNIQGAHLTTGEVGNASRFTINPAKQQHFIDELNDIFKKSDELRSQGGSYTSSTTGVTGGNYQGDPVLDALQSYKNSPDYPVLHALLTQKRQETLDKLIRPIQELENKRTDYINQQYDKLGYNYNPVYTTIAGKKEYIEEQKNLIAQAINLNAGQDINNKSIDIEKIHPISSYPDPITGELHIQYNTGGSSKVQDILVPTNKNVLNPATFDQWLVRAIETSPDKRTPLKGDGVLTSSDGKIRYSIGKKEALLGGGYQLYILDKNNPIAVPLPNGASITPGGIQYQIEQWAKMSNPATGKPMTAEDIIKTATNQ